MPKTEVNGESNGDETKDVKQKSNKINPTEEYEKTRGSSKQHLYMVVIGHVDAGKSTLMGHLLCALGQVILV